MNPDHNRFDGSIRSLSRRYQSDPERPFNRRLKHTTREKDLHVLKLIERAFGERQLAAVGLSDFWRWYDAAKKPKAPGGPERVRRAWGVMKKFRELVSYGVTAELPSCKRLREILAQFEFPQSARRRVTLDAEHVAAFIAKAVQVQRPSLALGTAIQFDLVMRQKDVIGE